MAPRLAILLLAIVAFSLCETAAGDIDLNLPLCPSCSNTGNYTGDSRYKKNLDQLLSNLSAGAIAGDWFYKQTVGTGPDQVFGLIVCYADSNATECQNCLSRAAAGVMQVCPGSRTVSSNYYGGCLLRYSNVSFFNAADVTYGANTNISYTAYRVQYVENMTTMDNARRPLMSQLAERAGDSKLKLDNGSVPYVDSLLNTLALYGLAQCTRDLAASECRRCLYTYVDELSKSFHNNSGGAIKGYSCYLKYQLGPFDITMPPQRSILPSPAPPPSPPPPPLDFLIY